VRVHWTISGNKLLIPDCLANVRKWRFQPKLQRLSDGWVRRAAMTFGRICIDTFGSSSTVVTCPFR
jgi:hypothetical protein